MHRVLASVLAAVLAPSAFSKEIGKLPSEDQAFEATLATAPETAALEVNRVTSLVVLLTPKDPMQVVTFVDVTFDARMPEHNHGMVVKPKVAAGAAPGEFRIDGVKLHMKGSWELTVKASAAGKPVVFKLPLTI